MKHLIFDTVSVDVRDSVEDSVHYHPTERPESFSANFYADYATEAVDEDIMEEEYQIVLDDAIRNWILYVGSKYPRLQELELYSNFDMNENELVNESLTTTLANMKRLKTYSVDICPVKQSTYDAMKANNIQLDYYGFLINNDDPIGETFTLIQAAQSVSTVSSLSVTCNFETDASKIYLSLTGLCLLSSVLAASLNNINHYKYTCYTY